MDNVQSDADGRFEVQPVDLKLCGYEWKGTKGIVGLDPLLTHRCIEKGAHVMHLCHCWKQTPNKDYKEEKS